MAQKLTSDSPKSLFPARQIVTGLGILLLTFGVFAWQLSAFNKREMAKASENPTLLEPPEGTHWHEATKDTRIAIAGRIRGQLSALRQRNYAAALQYSTTALRQGFPETRDFQNEIEANYPQLLGNKNVRFRFVNTDKKLQFANAGVTVTAPDGKLFDTVYVLSFEHRQWNVRGIARPHLAASQKP